MFYGGGLYHEVRVEACIFLLSYRDLKREKKIQLS
jgi:hypothetical protein